MSLHLACYKDLLNQIDKNETKSTAINDAFKFFDKCMATGNVTCLISNHQT